MHPTRSLVLILRATAAKSTSATAPHLRLRPRAERDTPPTEQAAVDPFAILEDSVRQKLDAGALSLRDVTAQVTAELPEDERFRAAGRVAQVVARLARTRSERERPWLPVDEAFAIEEWTLPRKGGAAG